MAINVTFRALIAGISISLPPLGLPPPPSPESLHPLSPTARPLCIVNRARRGAARRGVHVDVLMPVYVRSAGTTREGKAGEEEEEG